MSNMLSFRTLNALRDNSVQSAVTLNALRDNSEQTAALQRLTREDNNVTSKLTLRASEDAKTLKTITILNLIYLPATFVAVSPIWKSVAHKLTVIDVAEHGLYYGERHWQPDFA